jgi:hypothetical protein
MSLLYAKGNQPKAAQIARQLVKPFAITDIECAITEGVSCDEIEQLCTAVNPEYPKIEKRLDDIEKQMENHVDSALCGEYSGACIDVMTIRQLAWFNLGFQAAIRLLGEPPEMHVVNGGATQRKRMA